MATRVIRGRGSDASPAAYVPNEDDDSLHSKAKAHMLYCLGEGEWAGLVDGDKSVFINGTPLQGPNGFTTYQWESLHNYILGELTEPVSASWGFLPDHRVYKCTQPGTSGATEPMWGDVDGGTTSDGSVIWTDQALEAGNVTNNFADVYPLFRWGSIDQDSIRGFASSKTEIADGRELKRSTGPLVIGITDLSIDAVIVTMGFPSMTSSTAQGDVGGADVGYLFELQDTPLGPYNQVKWEFIIGKTTTRYQRSTSIRLSGDGPWNIQVTRFTADSGTLSLCNKSYIDSYTKVIEDKLSHPGIVLAGITANAKTFSQIPQIAFECNMLKVSVPDNYTPRFWTPAVGATPGFWTEAHYTSDMWTGTMTTGANKKHTANPAWILYDLLTNVDYGLGKWIKPAMVNKWALYKIAGYCDGLVDVVSGGITTKEPRFTCNLYLASAEEAYKVIENLCSIFRGMAYWSSGSVFAVDDSEQDPVYEYTCSNVTEEGFNYSTPERRQRHNVAMVAWNDPADGYRQKVEYVQDMDGIVALGRVYKTDVVAFGSTSQGQAQRFGRAILYTERFGEIVNFKTGFEGMRSRPGDPILIQDQFRDQVRLGGRIISSDGTNHVLDSEVTLTGGDKLNIVLPTGTVQERAILSASGATVTTPAFDFSPGPMCQWLIVNTANEAKRYRVFDVKEDGPDTYSISALTEDEGKWAYIDAAVTIPSTPDPPPGPNPDPGGALTPKNIALTVVYPNDGVTVNPKIAVSWDPIDRAKYHISWRKGAGNWTDEAIVMANAAEILNCPPDTYAVKVYVHLDNLIGPPGMAVVVVENKTAELDDWLTPGQKRDVKADWDIIISEQSDLDARAATNGVSATAYDAAITALTAFLNLQVGTGGWASGNWTDYTTTWFLLIPPYGATPPTPGGGNAMRALFTTVYTQRAALLAAIIAVASQPSDTFRPAIMWDMGTTTLDCSWTMTKVTSAAAASPYLDVARRWTWAADHVEALTPCSPAFALTGKDARVIMARVRLISGTWVGKAYFKGASPAVAAFSSANYKQSGAPVVGGNFADIAWDMAALTAGGTNYVSNTSITQIAMDFAGPSGVVEVDWIAVGTYGAGSKKDYDDAIAKVATDYMSDAEFLNGGKIDGTLIEDASIKTPALAANIIFAKNMIVANFDNLIPNPTSEQDITAGSVTEFEAIGISTTRAYKGSKSRKCFIVETLTLTPKIPVAVGDQYFYQGWAWVDGPGNNSYLRVNYYNSSGGTVSTVNVATTSGVSSTWHEIYGSTTVPDTAVTMEAQLYAGGYNTWYDNLYLRRMADSHLIVDGGIQANNILAGAVQTYHLSVGPNYQFKAKASGTPLMLNADGTFSANSSANADENDTDAATYMDDARIYPSSKTKTFEANFSGTQARGFLINMASAFDTETTGLRILHSGTSLTVHSVTGAAGRTYGAALTPTTGSTTVTTADTGKLTAVYSGTSGIHVDRRLILKLDGVEVATYHDDALPSGHKSQQSGYAGIILGAHAVRPGDVRIWGIALGIGSVTIQDGVVTADAIVSDLVTSNIIRSTTYVAGDHTNAATGFKLSGTNFDVPLKGGTAHMTDCNLEIGGNVVIAGYKAATMVDLLFTRTATLSYTDGTSKNWTVPDGVTSVEVLMVGGGGAGEKNAAGGGGGGGAGSCRAIVVVTPGGTIAYTVGAGGTGGTGNGPDGGNTSWDSSAFIAFGGKGGNTRDGGYGSTVQGSGRAVACGAGGTSSTYATSGSSAMSFMERGESFIGGGGGGYGGATYYIGGGAGSIANLAGGSTDCGNGGASGLGLGSVGVSASKPAAPTGFGAGGGGTKTGATAGDGANGVIYLRW